MCTKIHVKQLSIQNKATRRRYMTCSVHLDCPLGRYDANGKPLNRLGDPSKLGLDHALEKSSKLEILEARSQGDSWVSPTSTLFDEAFSEILASSLEGDVDRENPRRNIGWTGSLWVGWHDLKATLSMGQCFDDAKISPRWLLGNLEYSLGTIREEYANLSSELTYEFNLCNPRASLSYMDREAFMERMLARVKALFKSLIEVDQVATYQEGSSSGTHDEGLADPPLEEVAGQDRDRQENYCLALLLFYHGLCDRPGKP
uniref:Uncharacterized protein n=1 Tax=Cannabis sativa TaxID=3483 RepID=A0A803PRY3_CANSA